MPCTSYAAILRLSHTLKKYGGYFQALADELIEVAVEATEEAAFDLAAEVSIAPLEAASRPSSNSGLRSNKKFSGKTHDKCVLS
jgi:hypothetical protein